MLKYLRIVFDMRPYAKIAWVTGLLFFVLNIPFSFSQTGTITGLVKGDETTLSAATISVGMITRLSDSKGVFSISLLAGPYTLSVTHVGFRPFTQQIIIKAGESQELTISLAKSGPLGEVVVLGSRSVIQRSNLISTVPVDVFTSKELKQTGCPSLIQMLNFVAPALTVSRQHYFEPVTFRGLSPDHLLILLNGTRYHKPGGINSGGIKGTLGPGSVGNNLHTIPFSAIEKIEILRDGSSAQYGSDAIAGVMNIELKKNTGKTTINLHTGQHYKGDGESFQFGINKAVALSEKGFLNFSGDFLLRKPTYRGGRYLGTVYYILPQNASSADSARIREKDETRIKERGFSRQTPVSNDGSIQLASSGILLNGGCQINKRAELFITAVVNYTRPVNTGLYRYPKDTNQVNTLLYPDGFKPIFIYNNWDISWIAGARGTNSRKWNWEWNSVLGTNSGKNYVENTNNPSQFALGAKAATDFYLGSFLSFEQTHTISFVKNLKGIKGVKAFNVGFGGEYRFEKIRSRPGEEGSWENYDKTGRIIGGGIMPSPGLHPRDAVKVHRNVTGLYADLESDIDDHLLLNLAGRYEHYSDFGNNLAGKLAARYQFSPAFTIRSSISNGFRAPALQQIHYTSTESRTAIVGGTSVYSLVGTFNNKSDVTRAFGVKPLKAEKAINISTGITSAISSHLRLSMDAYLVQIKDRIILSGRFDKRNTDAARILALLPGIDEVRFITNAVNTRTHGIDVTLNGNWKRQRGSFDFILAANFTKTSVFGDIQIADSLRKDSTNRNTLFNLEERSKMEKGQPGSKIILSLNYKIRKWGFVLRNTRFEKTATTTILTNPPRILYEHFSPKILTDLSINYKLTEWLIVTAGANNIFDVYPDRLKNYDNTTNGILLFSNEASPFGYNGGYYFVNLALSF